MDAPSSPSGRSRGAGETFQEAAVGRTGTLPAACEGRPQYSDRGYVVLGVSMVLGWLP